MLPSRKEAVSDLEPSVPRQDGTVGTPFLRYGEVRILDHAESGPC